VTNIRTRGEDHGDSVAAQDRVATEEQAAVVQQIARDVLGGKGFAVDYEGQDEDGLGVTMVVLP
jgi:hypothetical protein